MNEIEIDSYQSWAMIEHAPAREQKSQCDLLFLHGMAAGSWVWTDEWLARFTAAGYRCWTMTLPGRERGGTVRSDPRTLDRAMAAAMMHPDPSEFAAAVAAVLPGAPLFDGPDLEDYTDALAQALSSTGRPTVVVGHSLGGAVVQNLLRRGRRPAGTVLVCSAPPYGLWRASLEIAFTNLPLWKALFDFSFFGVAAVDVDVMRRNLFPNGIDEPMFQQLLSRFTDESLAATARTPGFPPFAPLPGAQRDMLIIGASEDRLVPPLDIQLTGFYYATAPQFVQGAGHMPMYEPQSSKRTAEIILDWLPRVHSGG
ncbi:alpha/beta fold hydrolase [Tropicimonas marinistellae]|uniref:alpha/beta fold hydrolase n=1 Tax=Tropicimonas marinistellae TaxID=1739787 RepID=UPI000833E351|nr:alpha/beta hydrolase [Tropicimonas marinistellae]